MAGKTRTLEEIAEELWERVAHSHDSTEEHEHLLAALRQAEERGWKSALPPDPAPGPDRYAEGWRAGVEASARVLEGARMAGPIHAEVMHASARAVRELAGQRALPVPEPAPAGEKEGGR